jgi:hypothetical protein
MNISAVKNDKDRFNQAVGYANNLRRNGMHPAFASNLAAIEFSVTQKEILIEMSKRSALKRKRNAKKLLETR